MDFFNEYKIEEESLERRLSRGGRFMRQFLSYGLKGKKFKVELDAGKADDIYVFREKDNIYVLGVNSKEGYVGLEKFNLGKLEKFVFLERTDVSFVKVLGRSGLKLKPKNMAERLVSYMKNRKEE
jgi:hypothetical protein